MAQKELALKKSPSEGSVGSLTYYKTRYTRAQSNAVQWWTLLQAAYHYCIPHRNLFYQTNQVQGKQKNAKVYDTTGITAVRTFVSKIHNGLTPPQQTWCQLAAGTDIPEDQKEQVNEWLQKNTDKIFNYLRSSNFDLAIHECYYDLAVGTAALVVNNGESDDKPLKFYSIPVNQLAVEESINGFLESAYRTFGEVKISEIPIMWPNAKLPSYLLVALEMDPNATVKTLIEGVVYEHGKEKPFTTVLWSDDCPEFLLKEESTSSPWVIFRWSRINTETMGRGPAIDALPSLISLQEIMRLELTAANMNICKPYMAYSDGVFNPWTFKIQPNTIIPIAMSSAAGTNPPIIPMPDVANPAFMQLTSNDLRNQVNKLFFADPLGALDQSPQKTATEAGLRTKELIEQIGPIFTRLQMEFLNRLIQRIIYILTTRGLMEPLTINGRQIEIKYQSPLVVAQGQQDVQTVMSYVGLLQQIFGPETAITMLNPVELPHYLADKMGVDLTVLIGKEKLKAFLDSESQKTQELQMLGMEAAENGIPG